MDYFIPKSILDYEFLKELFNHSAPSVTLRYIGINQDKIDQAYDNFSL